MHALIARTRGILVDFGFAGLIDKIEERFGKLVANLVMFALVFLVFAGVLNTITSFYVSGSQLWRDGGDSAILGLGKLALVHAGLIFFSWVVICSVFHRMKTRVINGIEKTGEEARKDVQEYSAQVLEETKQKADKLVEEHRAKISPHENKK